MYFLHDFSVLAAQSEPQDWGLIWSTVFTGIAVVFVILILLIIIMSIMGKIFQSIDKNKKAPKPKNAQKPAPQPEKRVQQTAKPAAVSEAPAVSAEDDEFEDVDDGEIVAVIAAAIAAFSEADGKEYRITGIKRRRNVRSGWSAAGIADNTRGFMS